MWPRLTCHSTLRANADTCACGVALCCASCCSRYCLPGGGHSRAVAAPPKQERRVPLPPRQRGDVCQPLARDERRAAARQVRRVRQEDVAGGRLQLHCGCSWSCCVRMALPALHGPSGRAGPLQRHAAAQCSVTQAALLLLVGRLWPGPLIYADAPIHMLAKLPAWCSWFAPPLAHMPCT